MQTDRPILSPLYLETIFSRYGKNSLRVKQDVYSVLQSSPNLLPKEDFLISPDGISNKTWKVIVLEGTIPINFRGVVYNIPVAIWIPPNYPNDPPLCFVVPAKGMEIKPKHLHVDSTGKCYLPFLHQWRLDSSNLVSLVYHLSSTFSLDPPVYSTPKIPILTSLPHPPPSPPSSVSSNVDGVPTEPTKQLPYPTSNSIAIHSTNSSNGEYENNNQQNVSISEPEMRKLLEQKTSQSLDSLSKELNVDMERYQNTHSELFASSLTIESGIEAMKHDLEILQQREEMMDYKVREITEWIDVAEKQIEESNFDDLIAPSDSLSAQMYELVAEDAAIEDIQYVLNKSLERGKQNSMIASNHSLDDPIHSSFHSIPNASHFIFHSNSNLELLNNVNGRAGIDLETYLKVYRVLSREQFFKRALSKKIFILQNQQLQAKSNNL